MKSLTTKAKWGQACGCPYPILIICRHYKKVTLAAEEKAFGGICYFKVTYINFLAAGKTGLNILDGRRGAENDTFTGREKPPAKAFFRRYKSLFYSVDRVRVGQNT